jgi:hypothetical protein
MVKYSEAKYQEKFQSVVEIVRPSQSKLYPALRDDPKTGQAKPTSVGHSFELFCLGKVEDNGRGADHDEVEYKTSAAKSASGTVRLGTLACDAERALFNLVGHCAPDTAVRRLTKRFRAGKPVAFSNGMKGLMAIDDAGLRIDVSRDEQPVSTVRWQLGEIADMASRKLHMLAIVKAKTIMDCGERLFDYHAVDFYAGLTPEVLVEQIAQGKLAIEFRMRDCPVRGFKNNGTALVCSQGTLKTIYPHHWRSARA